VIKTDLSCCFAADVGAEEFPERVESGGGARRDARVRLPGGGDKLDGQLDERDRRRRRDEAQAAQAALSHVCAQEQKQTLLTRHSTNPHRRDTFCSKMNLIFIIHIDWDCFFFY